LRSLSGENSTMNIDDSTANIVETKTAEIVISAVA